MSESKAGQCTSGSKPQDLVQVMTSAVVRTDKCAPDYRSYRDFSCRFSPFNGT